MPSTAAAAAAAMDKLYNPFRDVKKAKEETERKRQIDPFAGLSFVIQPPPEFAFFPNDSNDFSQDAISLSEPTTDNPQHPEFDPFGVINSSSKAETVKENAPKNKKHGVETGGKSTLTLAALAPKLVVKLTTHEEVTSRIKMALDELDVTSEVSVEGTVYAQVQCSDANKNAPFAMLIPRVPGAEECFLVRPNEDYAQPFNSVATNAPILVTIPKQDIVAVPIAYYSLQQEIKFMPVLVERKITRNGTRVRIAIQVRSRLDNNGDMKAMTILVAVPEKVNGTSVTITRGSGVYDELKRTIKWKLPALNKGDSALVIAEADLWQRPAHGDDETPFPILFRCTSIADPIMPLQWKVAQVTGSPAHISVASIQHTFRLMHRLP